MIAEKVINENSELIESKINELVSRVNDQESRIATLCGNVNNVYLLKLESLVLDLNPLALLRSGDKVVGSPVTSWIDISASGNNAVPSGSPGVVLDSEGRNCPAFDGINDYFKLSFSSTASQPTIITTVIQTNATPLTEFVLFDGVDVANQNKVRIGADPGRGWYYYAGGTEKQAFGSVSSGTWYYVTAVFDGANTKLYVNGTEFGWLDSGPDGINGLTLGAAFDFSSNFAGRVALVCVISNPVSVSAAVETVHNYVEFRHTF